MVTNLDPLSTAKRGAASYQCQLRASKTAQSIKTVKRTSYHVVLWVDEAID